MKKTITTLLTVVMISGTILASGVLGKSLGTKKIDVPAQSSGWIIIQSVTSRKLTVSAKADHGRVYIEIFGPKGKKVASGIGKASTITGRQKGKYKVVFKNKTSNVQKVVASWSWGTSAG